MQIFPVADWTEKFNELTVSQSGSLKSLSLSLSLSLQRNHKNRQTKKIKKTSTILNILFIMYIKANHKLAKREITSYTQRSLNCARDQVLITVRLKNGHGNQLKWKKLEYLNSQLFP